MVSGAAPAEADCLQSGTTVTCSGASPGGFDAGIQDSLTVNVQPGATVGTGLTLNNSNVVTNSGTISVLDSAVAIGAADGNLITSTGTIQGGQGAAGIFLGSGGSVTHSGTMILGDTSAGISFFGAGTITNSGTITLGDSGVALTGSMVTNAATGRIMAGDGGIGLMGQIDGSTLINRGSIVVGPGGAGILGSADSQNVLNAGAISYGDCGTGIFLAGVGNTVTNTGTITGVCSGTGIDVNSSSTVTNAGTISGGDFSVGVFGAEMMTITNSGRIVGGVDAVGIYAQNGSVVANSGIIQVGPGFALGAGMLGDGDGIRLSNSGTIIGGDGTPGMIVTGRDGTLANSGTITVGNFGGGLIAQGRGAALSNTGTINVGVNGIGIDAQGRDSQITNDGTIRGGDTAFGIQAVSASTIANSGTIIVGNNGIGISGNAATTIVNSGSIVAGIDGIGMRSGGNMTNTGTITVGNASGAGVAAMLAAGDGLQLTNGGTIVTGTSMVAMSGSGNGLMLLNSGTVEVGGGATALSVTGTNAILRNEGTISVGAGGIGLAAQGGNAGLTNSGTLIVGTGGTGIAALSAGTAIANSGTIATCGIGIDASGGSATSVTNSGSIAGNGCAATGVNLGPGTALANSGTIAATVALGSGTGGGASIVNTGAIDGALAIGGTGGNTLVNSGTIGISAPLAAGGGVAHVVDGTFAQTGSGMLTLRALPTSGAGNYDTLAVRSTVAGTGTANLAGTLQAALQPGLYALSTTYAGVLTFAASTGSFSGVVEPYTFLDASLVYHPTSIDLVVTRRPFNQVTGGGANAQAVGNVLEANYSPNLTGLLAQFYMTLLQATASNTLSQLSGEAATAPQTASFTVFGQFLDTIFGQTGRGRTLGGPPQQARSAQLSLAAAGTCSDDTCQEGDPQARRYTAWAQGFGGSGSIDGSAAAGSSRIDLNSGGGALGMDLSLGPDALVGFTMGTTAAGYSLTDLLSSGNARSIVFGLYGGYAMGPAYVDAALAYAYNTFTTSRFVGIGSTSEIANASFDGSQYGGRVEGGWRFAFDRTVVTPFAGLTVQALSQSAYTESSRTAGSGAPGLLGVSVQAQTSTSVRSVLGMQFETAIAAGDGNVVRPRLRLGWAHEFNTDRSATAAFTLLPNAPFQVVGAEPAPNALTVGAGLDIQLGGTLRLYGQFDGEFASNARAFAATGGLRLVW
ncbi:MAG: autotransporter domain-containing protein [Pseudomonadota bacterium]